MVSSFSNPGFPHMHAHPTRLPAMDARLFAAIDSFEASMRAAIRDAILDAMDSALTAIHKSVNPVLAQIRSDLAHFQRDLTLGVEGDSNPASMRSEEAESIEAGHHKPHNGGSNPLRISSTIPNHSIPLLLSSSPMFHALANSTVTPYSNNSAASTVLFPESKTMIAAPQLLHKHSFSNTTKTGPEVVLHLCIISAISRAKFPSLFTDYYGACLKDKFGWVHWYLVGKFVKKNFYALHLFDDMSKRHNRENMSLSSNLEALDIVVLVCRSLPKDLAARFTEANETLGHINAIKQFHCLSLLHICAFTVMAISQLDYSIFTSLLSTLNLEWCHRVDIHLDVVFFLYCVVNDQSFQQLGWCHTLTDPCANISYQRVVFNKRNKLDPRKYAIWLMERRCILLSFKVVEENGKRKGFGFVQFDKEDSVMAAASASNDTIGKGKNLYVTIFVQASKNDNMLRILSNTLNPVLYQEVVYYKGPELATNITEACNNRVFGQIVLLLVQIVTTMIRFLEVYANLKGLQDGHFRQEEEVFATLSHKHRNDPLKLKEIIFMVAISLTSLLNLEIEFKLLLQEDRTTTASILFFLVYGRHFKEQGKSRTTPYVTVLEQHVTVLEQHYVSHHVFSYVIGTRWILVELELHHKKTGRRIQMFTFDTTQPPYVFVCQLYTLTEVMKDMVEALGLLRSSKSSMHNIGVAYDGLKCNDFNDSERIAVFNIQYRLVPSISLFQKMEFYDSKTLGGPSITEKIYEMCFHEGKMTEKDITPMGGFPHCGAVKDGYVWSNEWRVGPKKRIVNLQQRSPFSPFDAAACFLATSMEVEMKLWGAAVTSSGVLSGSSPQVVSYLQIVFAVPATSLLLQDSLVSARSIIFSIFNLEDKVVLQGGSIVMIPYFDHN